MYKSIITINPYNIKETEISLCIKENNINLFTTLFNDKKHDIKDLNKYLFKAALFGRLKILKLLLTKSDANPSLSENHAISIAFRFKHEEIISYLWQDERVRKSLKNDNEKLYDVLFQREKTINKIKRF
jgi:hypothetical protein